MNDSTESPTLEEFLRDADPIDRVGYYLNMSLEEMRKGKPNDRTPVDRYWAVCITDLERTIAMFDTWVARYSEGG